MKLLFVYNSNSGKLNALLDAGHKLFSPNTYKCNLCGLTFDTFSENNLWKSFREQSTIDMEFLHIDEFEKEFSNSNFKYPIILKLEDNKLNELLSSKDIEQIETVEELIDKVLKQFQDDNVI